MEKKVLITGGNKGIGLEVTRTFIDSGYFVYVVARDFTKFPLNNSSRVKQISFDLKNIGKLPELAEEIEQIDVLINNAGIMNTYTYDNYPADKKEKILKINLEAPVELIRLFSKGMLEKGSGRIVNVVSIAGQIGHPDIWYGISKAGLINATKSYAKSLGPKGIIVNAVAPSPVNTVMLNMIPDHRKEQFLKTVITGRFAEPEEVAKTIFWLATDSPEYINGICIDMNNGSFLR